MARKRYLATFFIALAASCAARAATAQDPSGLQAAAAVEGALVHAIADAEKSVVAIARVRKDAPSDSIRLESRPDAFGRKPPEPADPAFVPNEYATGVVVDRRGLVLTAFHVLGEESDYYITTAQRRVYRATIKAADPWSDLAVLAVDGADVLSGSFVPVRLGDASTVRKGQIVITLGNPHAIARDGQASAGWGIVSNLNRKAPPLPDEAEPAGKAAKTTLHHYGTLIQTDAKLHQGASGGPLVDLKGRMVGLCTAQAAAAGYESSAGYAIPVDATFRRVLDVLMQGREVEYGLLGIVPHNLKPAELAAGLQGIRAGVDSRTPAARAGLREGDIITAVDGRPIYDSDGLKLEVGRLPIEAVVRLDVVRDGARKNIEVALGKYPVNPRRIATARPDAWRGVRVDYPSALADPDRPGRSGLLTTDDAVIVADVDANTPAAAAGMKKGALISHVDGHAARTPKEFRAATAGKSGPVELRMAAADPAAATLVVPPGS